MFPHQFKKLIADLPLRRGDGHKTKFREQRTENDIMQCEREWVAAGFAVPENKQKLGQKKLIFFL